MSEKSIFIIGAGPAGLMAAVAASEEGAVVTVLEQNEKAGRKLLATGNGRCNYTNRFLIPDRYHGDRPGFQDEALRFFNNSDVIGFFTELGILPDDRDGYMYPRSHQASSVLEALLRECRLKNVRIRTGTAVSRISKDSSGFQITTDTGWNYTCDFVILCSGSSASQIQGSSGKGYEIAAGLGHHLIPHAPALVPLKCGESLRWEGVRTYGAVSLYIDGEYSCVDAGELQLTEYGISGIPVFQISRTGVRALSEGKRVTAELDFLPDMSSEQLNEYAEKMRNRYPDITSKDLLSGLLPEKLCRVIAGRSDSYMAAKEFPVTITGTLSEARAQICQGGIDTREVDSSSMESLIVPGLYFAGEILDIDGPCGGYNLQWAWSSGRLAGKSAASNISGEDS